MAYAATAQYACATSADQPGTICQSLAVIKPLSSLGTEEIAGRKDMNEKTWRG